MVMPYPAVMSAPAGSVKLAGATLEARFVGVKTVRLERAVARAAATLRRLGGPATGAGYPVEVRCRAESAPLPSLGADETYRLTVRGDGASIEAAGEWGTLHGLTTLCQLVGADGSLPLVTVEDEPRFPWRGLLLDPARRFLGLRALRRTLDGMALCKLNVLHLHLSDDQAFRFPSSRYPRLPSEEHYTRTELESLVADAADRGIRVVPELDMPGHTTSWLTAYPEWGTGRCEPSRRFGVHEACLDPTSEAVHEAVGNLLGELAAVFPDECVHFGGDEVHPAWWNASERVQAFMAANGIPDVAALQARFNRRVAKTLETLGRTPVGWDEVQHPDLDRGVLVQTWRGATARGRVLAAGGRCVESAPYYLDLCYPADVHYRFDPEAPEAEAIANEDALLRDPRLAHAADGMRWTLQWRKPADAAPAPGSAVLGAEACLWGELVSEPLLDVRLWGRLPAVAERFWSPAERRDVPSLYARLETFVGCLTAVGIDVAGDARRLAAAAGANEAHQPLLDLLEPVKWYGRLLGEDALAARIAGSDMPLARPYDADTPLDRIVDGLPPESLAARRVAGLCERARAGDAGAVAALARLGAEWRAAASAPGLPVELASPAAVLGELGALLEAFAAGRADPAAAAALLARASVPHGEYVLAAAPALTRLFGDG